MKSKVLSVAILTATLLSTALRAEEAGSGHYLPGAMSSFIDVPPGKEGFVYVNLFTFYNGSATAGTLIALITRAGRPIPSSASFSARPLMTVPSMPM